MQYFNILSKLNVCQSFHSNFNNPQVSALSGCITTHPDDQCNAVTADGLCIDSTKIEHGLRHNTMFLNSSVWCTADSYPKQTSSSPWLFDVARESGYVTSFSEEFCFDGSPYVTQGNIFVLKADIEMHKAHCRLAERYLKHQGLPIQPNKLWQGKTGFHLPCIDGTSGLAKMEMPFKAIEQMWDAYASADMPRFAFLNAMAAHDYSPRWEAMALGAEAYDDILLRFLKNMLATADASETVIIVRSDHGLQDGPSIVDYSTQVEHSRPWTEIIVPQYLEGVSLEALSTNQGRLASGFDLYRMLGHLMTSDPKASGPKSFTPSVPDWSINILTTEIPKTRSCRGGRIPLEHCRNELEKSFIAPSYGTCNKFDPTLRFFCPNRSGERIKVKLPAATEITDQDKEQIQITTPKIATTVSRQRKIKKRARGRRGQGKKQKKLTKTLVAATDAGGGHTDAKLSCNFVGLPGDLRSTWHQIDDLVKTNPKSKVSGGIFLYPRQQALFTTILRELSSAMMRSHGRPLRICETGFGAGHSAALFLAASDHTMVLSFDKFDRPYQMPVANLLSKRYPNRLLVFEGDSCQTVPKTLSSRWNPHEAPLGDDTTYQCDILHGSSLCRSDNIDLVTHSPRGALLTSTSMGSLVDKEVYFGPKAQWRKLRADNCVRNITCFEEEEASLDREFVFSRRMKDSTIKHKFCMGIVSGICSIDDTATEGANTDGKGQKSAEAQPLYDITESLDLRDTCSGYQVEVPREKAP